MLEDDRNRWNNRPNWNRHLLMADRALAVMGATVFNLLFSTGIVVIPGAFAACILMPNPMSTLMIGVISVFCAQSLMAFGRQSYFYDSYATWGFCIIIITLPLLILATICHYLYISNDEGSGQWLVPIIFFIQFSELVAMFIMM